MATLHSESTVPVNLGDRSYSIVVGSHILRQLPEFLGSWLKLKPGAAAQPSAFLVTDEHLADSHALAVQQSLQSAGWRVGRQVLAAGEQTKSLAPVADLYDRLIDFPADRHTVILAVGGGVMGDLAGFVAATYARGIPFVQIPTTLLAQVDSSVGGKVGVNHPRGKNMIGAFYQPRGVCIDITTLATLPARDYRSGLAEVIKYGMILDAEFFEYLEQHLAEVNARDPAVLQYVVSRCCRLKADVVERDEFERTGLRAVLNYGHTFAHAFEALSGYNELLHGEAVAIGMIYASRLAEARGLIDSTVTHRQVHWLTGVGLPVSLPPPLQFSTDDVLSRMRLDKKTVGGQLQFVLPTRLGHVELMRDIPEQAVRDILTASV